MKENFLIPVSIVVAGVVVAGAFFFSRNDSTDNTNNTNEPPAVDIRPISANDHILGNPNADFIIVEYSDLECPFCKDYHGTLNRIIDDYGRNGRVAWVYRHFPLTNLHPKAQTEAEATECAAELGGEDIWWEYTNKIFEVTPSNNGLDLDMLPEIAEDLGLNKVAFEECLESRRHESKVRADYDDAIEAGGTGTPFTVFLVKDQEPASINGTINYSQLKGLIDQTLLGL